MDYTHDHFNNGDEELPSYTSISPIVSLPTSNELTRLSNTSAVSHFNNDQPLVEDLDATPRLYETCSMILEHTDTIRFIDVPSVLHTHLREAVIKHSRIASEQMIHNSYEIKLASGPFYGIGVHNVKSHKLLAALLTEFARAGYDFLQSSKKRCYYFESCRPELLLPENRLSNVQIFALSLNGDKKTRLIDADHLIPNLQDALRAQGWRFDTPQSIFESQEITIRNGFPWTRYVKQQDIKAKKLLNQIFTNFRNSGYKLYATINIIYGEGAGKTQSLFFRKVGPSWH